MAPPHTQGMGPPPPPAHIQSSMLQTGAQAALRDAGKDDNNLEAIRTSFYTKMKEAQKAKRPGKIVKPISTRSISQLPLRDAPTEATAPSMPGIEELVDIFRVHRAKQSNSNEMDPDPERRSRISYTREQKLAAIAYYQTTFVEDKKGNLKPISKYLVAQKLDITDTMLTDWIRKKPFIEQLKKGTRKERSKPAQEPEVEFDIMKQFIELRSLGRRVTRSWFTRYGKALYKQRYPHRVTRINDKDVLQGLNFSYGWFCGFRKRHYIATRRPTKKAQEADMPHSQYLLDS